VFYVPMMALTIARVSWTRAS